uniref:Uncharacterized protein n=1 Tax=Panagrolaimus sp. JU765 TaxID=591449 RepID=A0AC34PWZ2_9BILA
MPRKHKSPKTRAANSKDSKVTKPPVESAEREDTPVSEPEEGVEMEGTEVPKEATKSKATKSVRKNPMPNQPKSPASKKKAGGKPLAGVSKKKGKK